MFRTTASGMPESPAAVQFLVLYGDVDAEAAAATPTRFALKNI